MAIMASRAYGHASEQGFVLLLPTDLYIKGGVASVVLTVILISVLPRRIAAGIFRPLSVVSYRRRDLRSITSSAMFLFLMVLLLVGVSGPHDPTRNALSLAVWAMFWVVLVTVQGVFGNVWFWLNPWVGPYKMVRRGGLRPMAKLPPVLGYWPALISFLAFAAVLLAHPAPADPDRLAAMVWCYWFFHFVGMVVFGPKWLQRAEGLTVLMNSYASIAPFGVAGGQIRIGTAGWKTLSRRAPALSLAVFMVAMLAVGSFDGLNETFWWFGLIGINPLEFPGRTAVVGDNLRGLAFAVPALVVAYGLAVMLGALMIGQAGKFWLAFRTFTPAILPIALAYHFAHYLTSFLVEIQYVARTIADAFALGQVRVTTGFFNTYATVRIIWLTQAGTVVLGHVVAILLSHNLALGLYGSHKKAAISQIPLALFMVAYTFFGLWLLASPRG